jgi:hypothetical protein
VFVQAPLSPAVPTLGSVRFACPQSTPSSAGVHHDIIFHDVIKCNHFPAPAPSATLLERRKNTRDVAKRGSVLTFYRPPSAAHSCMAGAMSSTKKGHFQPSGLATPYRCLACSCKTDAISAPFVVNSPHLQPYPRLRQAQHQCLALAGPQC